jgi:hypothetical protein
MQRRQQPIEARPMVLDDADRARDRGWSARAKVLEHARDRIARRCEGGGAGRVAHAVAPV